MYERRSHYNFPSNLDYQCQSYFDCGRRKHQHRHHCKEQFWSEPERTLTGNRHHHNRQQPYNEFQKQNNHHQRHQKFDQPKQFERHHHCYQQFSKPEGYKFNNHYFHQQCQFPFHFERRCHQSCCPFARPEKCGKHHFHQQFSPFERFGKCSQFSRQETCERRHPSFKQLWSFNEPCQFEGDRKCHHSCGQFVPFQPFERCHKHHSHPHFSHCGSFNQFRQFVRPKRYQRCRHQRRRYGNRSPLENFVHLEKHHHQFKTCPSFGPFKYQKHCKSCRRTCPSSQLFRKRFCVSKFDEYSSLLRIQRRIFRKQLRRHQIKHHFHHHKSHRFHSHKYF